MTWRQAQSAAMVAAAQAHADLGASRREPFVDVVAALASAGVDFLMWRPMSVLFGAYLKQPGAAVGVVVNNGIPFAARRMTLAHELGHHRLGHATSLDDEHTAGGVGGRRTHRWTDQEKLAECFAVWFLMPPLAVHAAARLVTGDSARLHTADEAYQASLLLGVPYRTLLRHLPAVRCASAAQAQQWATVPPRRLKDRAGAQREGSPGGHFDVFKVADSYDNVTLTLKVGDRLLFDTAPTVLSAADGDAGWPQWLAATAGVGGVDGAGGKITFVVVPPTDEGEVRRVSVRGAGSVHLRLAAHPQGLEQGGSLG